MPLSSLAQPTIEHHEPNPSRDKTRYLRTQINPWLPRKSLAAVAVIVADDRLGRGEDTLPPNHYLVPALLLPSYPRANVTQHMYRRLRVVIASVGTTLGTGGLLPLFQTKDRIWIGEELLHLST